MAPPLGRIMRAGLYVFVLVSCNVLMLGSFRYTLIITERSKVNLLSGAIGYDGWVKYLNLNKSSSIEMSITPGYSKPQLTMKLQ